MNEVIVEQKIDEIKKRLDSDPDNPELLNDLGVGHFLLGRYAESISTLVKAVHLNADNASYRYNLANSYSEAEKFDEAIDHYLKVLESTPDHIPSINNLADCYEAIGEFKKSRELFQYLTRIASDNALAHFNYGNFLLRGGDHILATKSYEKAIRLEPTFTDAFFNISWILFEVKAYQESLDYIKKGLQVDPQHSDLKELLSKVRNYIG